MTPPGQHKMSERGHIIDSALLEWTNFLPPWPQTTRRGWGTRMQCFKAGSVSRRTLGGSEHIRSRGGMCEWLKQAVLKTALPARVTGVRIPLPPPKICFRTSSDIQGNPNSLHKSLVFIGFCAIQRLQTCILVRLNPRLQGVLWGYSDFERGVLSYHSMQSVQPTIMRSIWSRERE